jgi:hypothetical protein
MAVYRVLIFIMMVILPSIVSPTSRDTLEQRGRSLISMNHLRSICSDDRCIIAADYLTGLRVFTVSDSMCVQPAGFLSVPTEAFDVAFSGTTVLLADGVNGVRLIDLSDLNRPIQIALLETVGFARAVACQDGLAIIGGDSTVWVADLSDTENPVICGTCASNGPVSDIASAGTLAVICSGGNSIRLIDVSNPYHPTETGFLELPGATGVAVQDNIAFVTTQTSLFAVSIDNPSSPQMIGTCLLPGTLNRVIVRDGQAYVSACEEGLRVVDVRFPEHMTARGILDTGGYTIDTAWYHNILAVADWNSGLASVDIIDSDDPEILSCCSGPDMALDILRNGTALYVADGCAGLFALNAETPECLFIVSHINTAACATCLSIEENILALTDSESGLILFDVSDPLQPLPVGHVATPAPATDVELVQGTAFIAMNTNEIAVYSCSDPANPVPEVPLLTPGIIRSFHYDGRYLYAIGAIEGVYRYDIMTPGMIPQLLPHSDFTIDVVTADDYIYLARGIHGMRVLNAQNPEHIHQVGSYISDYEIRSMLIENGRAFLATGDDGVHVLDIANHSFISEICATDTPGYCRQLTRFGQWVLVADETSVAVLDYEREVSKDASPANGSVDGLVSISPNPFNPETRVRFNLTEPQVVVLNVVNLRGQKVRVLMDEFCPAGAHEATWDGMDNHGKPLGSGMYFVCFETTDYREMQKMLLLK